MCIKGTCPQCAGTSWWGCGKHIPQVMDALPPDERWCSCEPKFFVPDDDDDNGNNNNDGNYHRDGKITAHENNTRGDGGMMVRGRYYPPMTEKANWLPGWATGMARWMGLALRREEEMEREKRWEREKGGSGNR